MKNVLLYIFVCLGIQLMYSQEKLIECTLAAKKAIIKSGETPLLELTFKNNSDTDIYLIKSLDASSYKWRYPYAYYTIELLGDNEYKIEQISRCGNMNGISTGDFIKVSAQETFKSTQYKHYYFSDYSVHNPNNFRQKGKYKITHHYSTLSKYLDEYMGEDMSLDVYELVNIAGDSLNPPRILKKPNNESKNLVKELEVLFAQVPKVELTSNTVIIEVK